MFFNKKSSKTANVLSKLTAVFMSAIIFSLLTGAVTDNQTKDISLVMVDAFADSENTIELTTRKTTVSEFLSENNIELDEFDRLSMLMEDELYDEARLVIRKGRNFTLNIDGNIEIITTTKKTVRDAFEEAGISISDSDRVEPSLDSNIEPNMNIAVYRVLNETVTEETEIPYKTNKISDSSLAKGTTKVKVQGKNGLKRTVYSIVKENGVETNREIVEETIVREPVTHEVLVGTKVAKKETSKTTSSSKKTEKANTSSTQKTEAATTPASGTVTTNSGKSFSYSKKFTVSATAYTDSSGNKTASGRTPQYGVIAVDPKVIPLGTKLYVESTDDGKSWTYGYCVAGDTGGAIKGNKIDLFFNSKGECLQFGRRNAIVYVLE